MKRLSLTAPFILACTLLVAGVPEEKSCCKAKNAPVKTSQSQGMQIPDIPVLDENGVKHRLASELIGDRLVAVSFIFTTCTTICPPIGANFAALEKAVSAKPGPAPLLLSISVDPVIDTPARLKTWKAQFGGGPNWTLVTGAKTDIDKALKTMQFFVADKTQHSPFLLLGNPKTGQWRRVDGFLAVDKIVDALDELRGEKPRINQAHQYFGDVVLTDQTGREHRLYSDLLHGKTIIMQSFFTSCKTVCPKTVGAFATIQDQLGDRLGKDVFMLSISVDPLTDSPQRLAQFAAEWKAREGWYFLTGPPENVRTALHKFGQMVDTPETHSNLFIIGNESTGLWKKAFGLAGDDAVFELLKGVADDTGVAAARSGEVSSSGSE